MMKNLDNNPIQHSVNYVHVEENSQFFDAIEQIEEYVEINYPDDTYFRVALHNTITRKYQLQKKVEW